MDTLLNLYEMAHPEYVPYITAAITLASVVATLLPPPTATGGIRGNSVYKAVYQGVHYVSLNFGHALAATNPKNVPATTVAQVSAS